jgi:atypical dual specificity phosphatase
MKPNLAHHMPPFPRTAHLPYKPNCTEDDLLATHEEVAPIFIGNDICIEEKVDGSNLGLILWDDHPVVRSKTHFLNKGFLGKTPAKNQYRSVWNWFHDHIDQFKILSDQFNTPPAVYGEWMYMSHGIRYDNLPNLFIAFDIYDGHKFIDFDESRLLLQECGFSVPPLLHQGSIDNYNQLEI